MYTLICPTQLGNPFPFAEHFLSRLNKCLDLVLISKPYEMCMHMYIYLTNIIYHKFLVLIQDFRKILQLC